eukprot:361050-Alexandrium_andersonii.AAC.1
MVVVAWDAGGIGRAHTLVEAHPSALLRGATPVRNRRGSGAGGRVGLGRAWRWVRAHTLLETHPSALL